MISRLVLRNFQKHENLAVDFGEGVTTIVGPTDSGKSAVLRALKFVCLNKPNGTAFVRHGKKQCSVTLTTDGTKIVRRRGKGRNEYRTGGQVYKAFGTEVPKPVAAILNVGPDSFQGQMDGPYWLGLPPGNLSKVLNEVVDLSLIDSSVRELGQVYRESLIETKLTKKRFREAVRERERLRPAVERDVALKAVEALAEAAEKTQGKIERLQEGLSHALGSLRTARRLSGRLEALERGERAFSAMESELTDSREKIERLSTLIDEVERMQTKVRRTTAAYDAASASLGEIKICPSCGNPI